MSYQDVKDRLYHGHRKVANNTYLQLTDMYNRHGYIRSECVEMRLHGNLIARFNPDYMELFSAGYYTHTTKSRLNMALQNLADLDCGVFQRDSQWLSLIHI